MNCHKIQDTFLDRHAGILPANEEAAVASHLQSCDACRAAWQGFIQTLDTLDRLPVPEPSPALRTGFQAMLASEKRAIAAAARTPKRPTVGERLDALLAALMPQRPAMQFAFSAAILLAGLLIGSRYLGPVRTVEVPVADPATQKQLAELRDRVDSMSNLVAANFTSGSTNQRLQNVIARNNQTNNSDQVLGELLNTLAYDSSTNVRLTALEALYSHASREEVRAGIIAALPRETSPIVQVAMIDFLAAARVDSASPTLRGLADDTALDAVVRTAARRALAQL